MDPLEVSPLSRLYIVVFIAMFAFASAATAQSHVTVTVDTGTTLARIPPDFVGLSIETGSLRSGNGGVYGNWFDDSTQWPQPLHAQMITIFRNLGIRNIRVGGGSVDNNNIIPTNSDIDAFFRFVKATNLTVIYSLRLLNGDITEDTNIAKYVWNNYGQYIRTLSIGNEPDFHSYHTADPTIYETVSGQAGTAFPSYLARWETFATAVSTAIPGVKFGGPDTGSNYPIPGGADTYYLGRPWTVQFADSTRDRGDVTEIYLHNYTGQSVSSYTKPQGMADAMLSTAWDNSYYPALFGASCVPLLNAGLPFRLTESNSFSGGLDGGSTCYATALYAMDYLHWWAAHGAAGVNFHNKQWVLNDAIYMDSQGNYLVHAMAYGIAGFSVGNLVNADSVSVLNSDNLNLTAYAGTDSSNRLFITIINKEHSTTAPFTSPPRDAEVSISAAGFPDTASVMYLTIPGGNVLATSGMTLGGKTIRNDTPFVGKWSPADTVRSGYYVVRVPAASAAIVRIGGPFVEIQTPTALAPKGEGVPRRATLNWTESTGAAEYGLQISSDIGFKSVVFDTTTTDTVTQLWAPLNASTKYYWHVRGSGSLYMSNYSHVDSFTTGTGILGVEVPTEIPNEFALMQNYPNPFNPVTAISYRLSAAGQVSLKVYDVLGREVETLVNERQEPGSHSVTFDASALPTGVYFYRLVSGSFSSVLKMILLK